MQSQEKNHKRSPERFRTPSNTPGPDRSTARSKFLQRSIGPVGLLLLWALLLPATTLAQPEGGAVIVEVIFQINGMGLLMIQSIFAKD